MPDVRTGVPQLHHVLDVNMQVEVVVAGHLTQSLGYDMDPTTSPSLSPTLSVPTSSPSLSPTQSPTSSTPTTSPTKSPTDVTMSPMVISYDVDFSTLFPVGDISAFEVVFIHKVADAIGNPTAPDFISVSQGSVVVRVSFVDPMLQAALVATACLDWTVFFAGYELAATHVVGSGTSCPTASPTRIPSAAPTANPTVMPTLSPTTSPTLSPTDTPSRAPSDSPSIFVPEIDAASDNASASTAAGTMSSVVVVLVMLLLVAGVMIKRQRRKRERSEAHGPVRTGKDLTIARTAPLTIVSKNSDFVPTDTAREEA